jgi:hypothetical protein
MSWIFMNGIERLMARRQSVLVPYRPQLLQATAHSNGAENALGTARRAAVCLRHHENDVVGVFDDCGVFGINNQCALARLTARYAGRVSKA